MHRRAHAHALASGLLALGLFLAGPALGREYHVSGQAGQAGDGSARRPFREIRQAVAVMQAGDTVLIGDGDYLGFDVLKLGAPERTTTFKATGRRAVVRPTQDRLLNDAHNIILSECTRVVVDGLRSFDGPLSGLRLYRSDRITVRNGEFGNPGKWGIVTSHCTDVLIENNECHGSKLEHGIYVANSGDRPVVRGNHLHHNAGSGLRSNGDIAEGGDGIISGAVYERNIIHDNGFSKANGGAAINLDGLQDGVVRNNLLYDNHASGIALFKGCGAAGPKGMQILHNTVIMPADARFCLRITDALGAIVVRNNVFYSHNAARGLISWDTETDVRWTDSDHNLLGGALFVAPAWNEKRLPLTRWQAQGHERRSLLRPTLKGLFEAPGELGVLTPAADSPLRDAGAPDVEAGPADLVGHARRVGPLPDLGAVERRGAR